LLALGLVAALGCSRQEEKFIPVAGQVTVNGQPLASGTVSFRPDPKRGNTSLHHPTGQIADGAFELYTLRQRGAPPGWYKVLVFADENQLAGSVHPLLPRWATHPKYTTETTTDLFVEVTDQAAPGAYDFRLSK
jgi:hypothetical protein